MKKHVGLLLTIVFTLLLFSCPGMFSGLGSPFENFANIVIVSGSIESGANGTYYLAKDPVTGEIDTTTYPPYYYINSKNPDYIIYYTNCNSTGWVIFNTDDSCKLNRSHVGTNFPGSGVWQEGYLYEREIGCVSVQALGMGGNFVVGQKLFAPATSRQDVSYQWFRNDDMNGTNKTIIPGATSNTYKLTNVDIGKYLSFEAKLGNDEPISDIARQPVIGAPSYESITLSGAGSFDASSNPVPGSSWAKVNGTYVLTGYFNGYPLLKHTNENIWLAFYGCSDGNYHIMTEVGKKIGRASCRERV